MAIVILAAGQGTRMKSDVAKVLHPIGGRAMIARVVDTAWQVEETPPVVVVGHDAEAVRQHVGNRARYVTQTELLGTGHAVMQAADLLRGQAEWVVVCYGDMPLLTAQTMRRLIDAQKAQSGPFTLLTLIDPDPRGFGRIVRRDGYVTAIVEERECTPEQAAIRELNVGVYAFRADWLWSHLSLIQPKSKGEYYLTDLVELATAAGEQVGGMAVEDADEVIGINTRVHLSEAEAILRRRVTHHWMLEGVTIIDPSATYIDETAIIGHDTVIYPNTHILGKTVVGAHCQIGPNSLIRDSQIGARCIVNSSVVERAVLEDDVDMGPFGHLRTGAYLASGVHLGNFGEVKNSRLGAGTRMGHFSYVGDSQIGEDVNIGAGVVTVNYDGKNKHQTIVGDHAFIGSDSMLVAPVTVSANARTAAGSVVTRDVPENHIAVGVPARMRPLMAPQESVPMESASVEELSEEHKR